MMGRATRSGLAAILSVFVLATQAHGQWAPFADKLVPRASSGALELTAPTPRTANGRPNLSGVWMPDSDPLPEGAQTVEGDLPVPRHMIDITADLAPEDVEMTPWAADILGRRLENRGLDAPFAYCKPTGVPFANAVALPYKIVQTPDLVLVLY